MHAATLMWNNAAICYRPFDSREGNEMAKLDSFWAAMANVKIAQQHRSILLPVVAAQNAALRARYGAALGLVRRFHDSGWNAIHPTAIVSSHIQAGSTTR